jgi:hypothetical protein
VSEAGAEGLPGGLLGPVGAAALGEARRALTRAELDAEGASLLVAGWAAAGWSFRFELPGGGRQVVVDVPHDGGAVSVREAGSGFDPFMPRGPA